MMIMVRYYYVVMSWIAVEQSTKFEIYSKNDLFIYERIGPGIDLEFYQKYTLFNINNLFASLLCKKYCSSQNGCSY